MGVAFAYGVGARHGHDTDREPAEAGKTGRGVFQPIAQSLNRSSEPSQFERWRDALLGSVAASARHALRRPGALTRVENSTPGLDAHARDPRAK